MREKCKTWLLTSVAAADNDDDIDDDTDDHYGWPEFSRQRKHIQRKLSSY